MLIVLVGGLCLPDKRMVWLSDCWFWLIVLFLVSGGVGCLGSLWVWPRVGCSIFLLLQLGIDGIDVSLGCGRFGVMGFDCGGWYFDVWGLGGGFGCGLWVRFTGGVLFL